MFYPFLTLSHPIGTAATSFADRMHSRWFVDLEMWRRRTFYS
jgi:hypothetical protein